MNYSVLGIIERCHISLPCGHTSIARKLVSDAAHDGAAPTYPPLVGLQMADVKGTSDGEHKAAGIQKRKPAQKSPQKRVEIRRGGDLEIWGGREARTLQI